jgi:hypothetical protein
MLSLPRLLLLGLGLAVPADAFDYSLIGAGGLVLTDVATTIPDVVTLFVDEELLVTADGLTWNLTGSVEGSDNLLYYSTLVNGKVQASGNVSLEDVGRELPTSIDAGTIKVDKGGRYTIEVVLTIDDSEARTDGSYEAYGAGVAIIPLLVVLIFGEFFHSMLLAFILQYIYHSRLCQTQHYSCSSMQCNQSSCYHPHGK